MPYLLFIACYTYSIENITLENYHSGNEWKMMIFVNIIQQCIKRSTILYVFHDK